MRAILLLILPLFENSSLQEFAWGEIGEPFAYSSCFLRESITVGAHLRHDK